MAVTLSPLAGAGWQFFDNNGIPLAGGLLYSYSAGTSTPLATYTSISGNIANSNPIVLDSAGRVPNEIWITVGFGYKFILQTANAVQIASWDNIPSNAPSPFANDASSIAYEEGYTVNAGSFVVGSSYQIASIGTTNFVAIGAATNTVGVYFTATGIGSGTGTAKLSQSVQSKLQQTVSVLDFGADPTGVTDSSTAFQAAINAASVVNMTSGTFLISNTVTIPSNRVINIEGTNIVANTGSNPLFKTAVAATSININGGGQVNISGTASSFLQCIGATNQPTSFANYASAITLNGLRISSTSIGLFLDLQLAVREVFVTNCYIYTENGINSSGANVAIYVANSEIFGSTGAAGTYGVKLRSPGGTSYFNQGWTFVNCTLDNFINTFDISDIFVFQVTSCYIGCVSTGYTFNFTYNANTTHTEEIMIGAGTVLAGPVIFNNYSGGGTTFRTNFSNFQMLLTNQTGFTLGNNCGEITINDGRFTSSGGSNVGINAKAGNNNCTFSNLTFDPNFVGGIIINDTYGAGYNVNNIKYEGTGSDYYSNAAPAQIANLPVISSAIAAYKQTFNQVQGTFATSSVMSTSTGSFSVGETGNIVVTLYCSGLNASTQLFTISVPTGMVLPSGSTPTNWSAANIYPSFASGVVSIQIPYYVTTAITNGSISITNTTGNSAVVAYQSYFGFVRNW